MGTSGIAVQGTSTPDTMGAYMYIHVAVRIIYINIHLIMM